MAAKYLIIVFLVACCLALQILGQVLPWATFTMGAAELKNYLFVFCGYNANTGEKIGDCKTYDSLYTGGQDWCSTQKSQAQGARAAAILGAIFFAVCLFFTAEKVCRCVERFRTGFWSIVQKITLVCGMVCAWAAFILLLLWYTELPDGCKGTAVKDNAGAAIAGSPFVFMAAGILPIIILIVEVKCFGGEASRTAVAGELPASEQGSPGSRTPSGYLAPEGAAPPPQQEVDGFAGQTYRI